MAMPSTNRAQHRVVAPGHISQADLRDDFFDHVRLLDTGQFLIESTVEVRQQVVIEAHQSQDRCVQIPDMAAMHDGFGAKRIGFAKIGRAHV